MPFHQEGSASSMPKPWIGDVKSKPRRAGQPTTALAVVVPLAARSKAHPIA